MSDFYKFAGEHPVLTFFLFAIVGQTIIYSFEAIGNIFRNK